jgi:F0F1-type ATP synthase beta subunit
MMTGYVVRECSRVVRTMELQSTTGCHRKLMKIATGEGGEVAIGDQTSGRCCGLVGNERMLSTVFSCGMHGN